MTDASAVETLLAPLGPSVPALSSTKLHSGEVRSGRILVGARVTDRDALTPVLASLAAELTMPAGLHGETAWAAAEIDHVHVGIDPGPVHSRFGVYLERTDALVRERRRSSGAGFEVHRAFKWESGAPTGSIDRYRQVDPDVAVDTIRSSLHPWPDVVAAACRLIGARQRDRGATHHADILAVDGSEGVRRSIDVSVPVTVQTNLVTELVEVAALATGTADQRDQEEVTRHSIRPARVALGVGRDGAPFLTLYYPPT